MLPLEERRARIAIAAKVAAGAGLVATRVFVETGEVAFSVPSRTSRRAGGFACHLVRKVGGVWRCPCGFSRSRMAHQGAFCAHLGAVWSALQSPPSPRPPTRRDSSYVVAPKRPRKKVTKEVTTKAPVLPVQPAAVIRALRATPGHNKIDNLLCQARRTFTRQCQTIVNRQHILQTTTRRTMRASAE